jgi:hypothetical protein
MTQKQIGNLAKRQMSAVTIKSFSIISKQKKGAALIRSILEHKLTAIPQVHGKEEWIKKALRGDKAGIRLLNSLAVDAETTEEKFFLAVALSELARKGFDETLEGLELLSVGSPNYYVRQRAVYGLVKLARNGNFLASPSLRSIFEGKGLERAEVNLKILAEEGLKVLAKKGDVRAQEVLDEHGFSWN